MQKLPAIQNLHRKQVRVSLTIVSISVSTAIEGTEARSTGPTVYNFHILDT